MVLEYECDYGKVPFKHWESGSAITAGQFITVDDTSHLANTAADAASRILGYAVTTTAGANETVQYIPAIEGMRFLITLKNQTDVAPATDTIRGTFSALDVTSGDCTLDLNNTGGGDAFWVDEVVECSDIYKGLDQGSLLAADGKAYAAWVYVNPAISQANGHVEVG